MVHHEATTCCSNYGRQSLLLQVPGLLWGEYIINPQSICYHLREQTIIHSWIFVFFQPGIENNKNCIADEHYLPTFFHVRNRFNSKGKNNVIVFSSHIFRLQMLDPTGISNWTVTQVDWSERKWHPKTYMPEDVTHELLNNLTVYKTIKPKAIIFASVSSIALIIKY